MSKIFQIFLFENDVLVKYHYNFSRVSIAQASQAEPLEDEELPLKFEEIVNVKTYDKMRPPRPGGLILFLYFLSIVDIESLRYFDTLSHPPQTVESVDKEMSKMI